LRFNKKIPYFADTTERLKKFPYFADTTERLKKFPYFADTTERLKEKGMIDKGGGVKQGPKERVKRR
jgi:hypothetical protein